MQTSFVTSVDGTPIAYLTVGSGPSVLVIPGALSTAADLLPFAEALGREYTVHIMERRGRGQSGPQGHSYEMGTERMDVLAIHRATGARFVFGHSYGGLIALEVARECNTFQKLALYEPGVSIGGSIGVDWMESYARHLRQGEREEAFVDFTVGSRPRGSRTLPRWLMKNLLRMVIRRPDRERMYRLLSENLREHQQIAKLDDSYPSYRTIRGDTLLMCGGTRGSSTACQTIETLAAVIPHAVTRRFAKLDHFGPIRKGPGDVAQAVALFFAARSSEHGSSGRRSGRSA